MTKTCSEYPCQLYDHADVRDSFITHLNQRADMRKTKEIGIEAYTAEQKEKVRFMAGRLREIAGRHGIELKLRNKTR